MANAKHYQINHPMRAKDGTLYRAGAAVPVAAKHVKEFGWGDRKTVDAPARPQLAGSQRAREKRVKRQASTIRVLTRHNIEDVNVGDLPEVLAGVDNEKAIAELKKADSRKTAGQHYDARLEELQPKPKEEENGDGGEGDAGGEKTGENTPDGGEKTGDGENGADTGNGEDDA